MCLNPRLLARCRARKRGYRVSPAPRTLELPSCGQGLRCSRVLCVCLYSQQARRLWRLSPSPGGRPGAGRVAPGYSERAGCHRARVGRGANRQSTGELGVFGPIFSLQAFDFPTRLFFSAYENLSVFLINNEANKVRTPDYCHSNSQQPTLILIMRINP